MPFEDRYRDDLAYIHDAGYAAVARGAARLLVEELTRVGCRSGTVVDLGCGSGILARHLVEAGYSVLGIDTSSAMVALARTRAPHAEFRVGSFVSTAIPSCIAVTATGEVLNYCFDPANDNGARAELFGRVYRALVPGGLWLFDVAGPERMRPGDAHRTFAEGAGWAVLLETEFDAGTGVLTRHITSFRHVGGVSRRDAEVHRLALVDPAGVLATLRGIGFEVQVITSYGASRLPQGVVAFLGRKPSSTA